MEAYHVVIDDHDLVLVDGPYTEMWWYDLSDGSTGTVPRPASSPASPVWYGCSATAPNERNLVTGGCWASAASPRSSPGCADRSAQTRNSTRPSWPRW